MTLLQHAPFWIHIILETPASLNFFFNPSEQLSSPAPQAHAIIRQYAVLLLVSNLIALNFALGPLDQTGKNVALALSVYHLAPIFRAGSRILNGDHLYGHGLGGPWLHLWVHGGCFAALLTVGLLSRINKNPVKN
ncbi:hypothetical protein D0Z07_1927 [Hyphodiscus hymeniophilus]|uniref:Uncharacterized protein n=1 Tax=Hyphodiscus hymeniophilus TaxID=353542 RepID=A0A9P6VNL4_9HELO|nr:hypothetical protein D0Z07_1927 [Hyphodiscus hymeniophilus]